MKEDTNATSIAVDTRRPDDGVCRRQHQTAPYRGADDKSSGSGSNPASSTTDTLNQEALKAAREASRKEERRINAYEYGRGDVDEIVDASITAYLKALRSEIPGNAALKHLGDVLSFFAELHPDDRCAAFEDALTFYNEQCPDDRVIGQEGFSIRRVLRTPLDDLPKREAQPAGESLGSDGRFQTYRTLWKTWPGHTNMAYREADRWLVGFCERYINEVEGHRTRELDRDQISAFFEMPLPPKREIREDACESCGQHQIRHRGAKNLCCECYVRAGHPPADWHAECMKTYSQIENATPARESCSDDLLTAVVGLSKACSGRLPLDSSDSVSVEAAHIMRLNKALADRMTAEINSIEGKKR